MKESVNHLNKPSAPFIAYTKPLFRLVKCMILALPGVADRVAVSGESLDGFKVLDSRSRS